ncbi:STAS-like domain-containing protein [Vibrio parahaemolyticus]|nr:STAS-like domain-containing protein [Vibrio parahaemolyticus]
MKIIDIKVSEFSEMPFGRYRSDGPSSAEVFRDDILIPALNSYDLVNIDLDGVWGYGSSFLSEVFDVEKLTITDKGNVNRINIITTKEHYRIEIMEYLKGE